MIIIGKIKTLKAVKSQPTSTEPYQRAAPGITVPASNSLHGSLRTNGLFLHCSWKSPYQGWSTSIWICVWFYVWGGWLGFFLLLLFSPEEGDGNPLQYSCLKSPWTEEPGGLQSMGSKRVGQDWATDHINKATYYGWLVMSWMVSFNPQCSKAVVPNLCGIRDGFHGRQPLTSWCVAQFITGGWGPRL